MSSECWVFRDFEWGIKLYSFKSLLIVMEGICLCLEVWNRLMLGRLNASAWESGVVLAQNDHASLARDVTFHESLLIETIGQESV